jgi:hypothetical protein
VKKKEEWNKEEGRGGRNIKRFWGIKKGRTKGRKGVISKQNEEEKGRRN